MKWHHLKLGYARKDSIDVFLQERKGVVEALCGSTERKICYMAVRFLGSIDAITFDQRGTKIEWTLVRLPEYCATIECDGRHNEIIPGHEPRLENLNCAIANAMNAAVDDRGFSRYVKKQIVRRWECATSALEIRSDGTYALSGDGEDIFRQIPATGKWFCGGRMLQFMNQAVNSGVRVALVSVSETELRFHGQNRALFQIYERKP